MSFLKFWSSKKGGSGSKKDDDKHGDGLQDPELEKRRLRHSLSISRSGRFKQRKRERSQIMDKPEIFGCGGGHESGPSTTSSSSSSSLSSQPHSDSESGRHNNSMAGATGGSAHHYMNSNSGNYRSSAIAPSSSASPATNSPKFTCRNINKSGMVTSPGGLRMGHPVVT